MMKQSSSEAMLSSSAVDKSHSSISWEKPLSSSRDGSGGAQEIMAVERPGEYTAKCRWTVESFPCRLKSKALWSKYFDVGGYDCRLLVYPKGDSQALPGYISIYLQIIDPRGTTSSLWDCFASYRLSIINHVDDSLTICKDSWHRFSSKKRSHGWCDFTLNSSILDPKMGFLFNNDSLLITADILILNESVSFSIDNNNELNSVAGPMPDVLSGNFTWRVNNFSLFKEMMKSQKITSPVFPAGDSYLRICVYLSVVNEQEYLSMFLDSSDTEKTVLSDKSSWCLFSMSAYQKPGCTHMNRESYGRFAADNKSGDNTSMGWNDYMKMSDFVNPEAGFLVDDTAVFSTSFHVIKESSSFTRTGGLIGGRNGTRDGQMGKFTWRIENFTRLVDLLEKRKITGLYIKSKRFQIGNRDCRLIVYPRGQSKAPCLHLSVFLEVTESRSSSSDWSCFVSHQLSVVNQRSEEMSVTKESQNRYSKAEKDWGWREFVTLINLFDQDAGFLVQDSVVFSAEVLILKETSLTKDYTEAESANSVSQIDNTVKSSFTWKVENFLAFKEIIEKRKIFSKFFQAGGCELRIGVYEVFNTICIYLESDQSAGTDADNNFWVKYKMGILNQKNPAKSVWKESSICTKTWNNSVLQFMKVSDMLEADAGFLVRDTVVFVCEILDCCPRFEFSDLMVLTSDDDQADALTTNPNEIIDSEESEEDTFQDFLSRAGFSLALGENPSQQLVTLQEKFLTDAGAISGLLTDLRVYLDDPTKAKRLLLPNKISSNDRSKLTKSDDSSPSLMMLLMGVKVLQQGIIDLLLDKMVEYCQYLKKGSHSDGCVATTSSVSKIKWSEQYEEILGLIVNSLKTIDAAVPQGFSEFRRRPHSCQKIGLVLDRAPKHLLQDLLSLVPKLVEHSEHSLAAYALIQRLLKPEAEISLREAVYNALSQLECDNKVWEHILLQSYEFLSDSNEESLVATIHFILKIASQCQQLPEAVRSVRERLKSLGADIAEMIRRDINSDFLVGL
ncbi:TRAF-like [Arabidopsis suecica]|uniref:TRAF-like n=1 Tax=Arabidopsis suecica TaxID=45249 RepID=A0A8T2AD34_ARASU|nr:TRAF-like [Arabidopsis suecica]